MVDKIWEGKAVKYVIGFLELVHCLVYEIQYRIWAQIWYYILAWEILKPISNSNIKLISCIDELGKCITQKNQRKRNFTL